MSIIKLNPVFKEYIWGGDSLIKNFNKDYKGEILAESWELACHKDGCSIITNGEFSGKTLVEYIEKRGKNILGQNCKLFKDFPILIKLIDSKECLSIQVHPNDEYALKNEGQYGKTEAWYVVDCEEDAFLYYGFNQKITKEEFRDKIKNNTILEVLNKQPVKKGDVYFIEAGTIHAIGKGIIIAEIQQNSNLTYRVYDYDRTSIDGKKRELHIEKAIEVTKYEVIKKQKKHLKHFIYCKYFTVDKVLLNADSNNKFQGYADEKSFVSLLVIDGEGKVEASGESIIFKKGDSIFIDANNGEYNIIGTGEVLITTV